MNLVKAPLGLLEFFRLKQNGRNPDKFADAVAPVVDISGFYGADSWIGGGGTSAPGALQRTFTEGTIAAARRYMTVRCLLTLGAAGGTWATARVYLVVPSGGTATLFTIAHRTFGNTETIATAELGVCAVFPAGLVLPPGHQIIAVARGNAGGADHTVDLDYGYQRLDGLP